MMSITNPPKAFIALAALIAITVLMITKSVDESAGVGMLGLIIGYAVGNGIAAKSDTPVEPIIGRSKSKAQSQIEVLVEQLVAEREQAHE
jgi:hypothetical protein